MARKLNLYETEAFTVAISMSEQPVTSDADVILRALQDRRDEALELSPESGMWFGDLSRLRSKD